MVHYNNIMLIKENLLIIYNQIFFFHIIYIIIVNLYFILIYIIQIDKYFI